MKPIVWTADELARARALSARPNAVYPTRREAAERYLRLAGPTELVAADAVTDAALAQREDGWTVAFDPAAFAVGGPGHGRLARRVARIRDAGRGRARPHVHGGPAPRPRAGSRHPLGGSATTPTWKPPAALWPLLDRLVA